MITIGEVAANVCERFYIAGHPNAYIFMEHVSDHIEVDSLDINQPLHYQGDKPAYCKYCHTTHKQWRISNEHFPPAWICERCDHATADTFMEIR